MTLHLFFSWQVETDTAKQHNKPFIWDCINAAAKKVENKGELKDIFIKPEEGLRDEAGTPDTIGVCESRIDNCHIFVADMTIAENYSRLEKIASWLSRNKHRVGPNRNVNNEYGRARGLKESGQIITVMNTINGNVEEDNMLFPVDVRKYRFPITFTLKKDEKYYDKDVFNNIKTAFIEDLAKAIFESAKVALKHIDNEMKPFINWQAHKKIGDFRGGYAETPDLIELKDKIKINRGNIRVLGMSGLGKTRLVLEAFKDNKENYWYYDCQTRGFTQLKDRLPEIFKDYSNYVLVFDNCDKTTSAEIVKLKRSCQGTNPIITIFNGIEEQSDDMYVPLSMQEKYDAVVEEIIKRYAALYKDRDKERIMDFAGGIPMMAQLLMDGLQANRALGDVSDENLMSKILLAEPGTEDRKLMQTLSMFDYIGYKDDSHKELEYVVKNKDITNIAKDDKVLCNDIDDLIEKNLKRKIIEQRGRRVGIRPAPIAFYLIGEWLSNCSEDRMIRVVKALQDAECAEALTNAFADQFRNMGFNEKARQMLNQLMGPNSPFSSAEVINTRLGSRLFRSFAEVNPVAVANTLWNALGSIEIETLRTMEEGRRNLVWTLEKLCFDPASFEPAAKLMLRLAQAENEEIGNNATQEFIRLFPVLLPATAVDLNTRLDFLKKQFVVEQNKPLLIRAIKTALHTRDFLYMGGAEKQGLKTLKNYQPQTNKELFDYLEGCTNLLMAELKTDSPYLDDCFKVIEDDFNSMMIFGAAKVILPCFDKAAGLKDYDWDVMLNNLYLLKVQKVNPLSSTIEEEVDMRIAHLTKTDYVSRFHYVSLRHKWSHSYDFEENLKEDAKQYEALADELVRDRLYDVDLLKRLFVLDNIIVEPYGAKIAQAIPKEENMVFFVNAIEALNKEASLGYSIVNQFLRTVDEDFFEEAYSILQEKKEYRALFAAVAVRGYDLKHKYVEKLFQGVEQGTIPVVFFQQYWSNLKRDQLTDENIANLFGRLIALPDGQEMVWWMAGMFTFGSKLQERPKTAQVLEELVINLNSSDFADIKSDSFWQVVFTLLESDQRDGLAKAINKRLLSFMASDGAMYISNYNTERAYSVLLEKYFDVVWPELSDALSGQNVWLSYHLQQMLGDKISNTILSSGVLFRENHTKALLEWCDKDPQNNAHVLMSMAPVEGETPDTFSEIVMELINRYGEIPSVLDALSANMGTFSYTGSVQPLYLSHINMLKTLTSHPKERVREWAGMMIASYEKSLEREKDLEEEQGFFIKETNS